MPTPEAHRLSVDVGNALDGIDRVRRSAEDVRRHGVGQLRLGVTPMLYDAVLHNLLRSFLRDHSQRVLTMETGLTEMMVDWLLRDQVELAFASMLENHTGIEAIPLIQTHSVMLMPPGHPLAAQCSIRVRSEAPRVGQECVSPGRSRW